jgi:SPP1 gp7 family putative phage head morphogenesis protein
VANPNQSIFDDTVRHRIALERYSDQDARQALKFLDELKQDIAARIARATPGRQSQLRRLLADVGEIHDATYRKINDELTGRWQERAGLEATFQADKLGSAVASGAASGAGAASGGSAAGVQLTISKLTTDAAFQAAMARPMDGAILSDWLTSLDEGARRRLDRALTISWTEGESLDRAVRRMRETVDISKRGARTLVRTANTHISNAVQQASAEANADIVKEVEWRSTLDSRTSEICRHRDGKRYPVNEGPRPPAHPNCRSIIIELLSDFPPPQREIYSEWIARQPASVQDEVLGPTRGKLLRQGKYKVTEFTNSAGKRIPLKDLGESPIRKASVSPKSPVAPVKIKTPKTPPVTTQPVIPKPAAASNIADQKKVIPPKKANLTKTEEAWVEQYSGDGFQEFNTRNPSALDAIDGAIQKSKTSQDVVLYRGLRDKDLFENAESMIGKVISNDKVQSTSFLEKVAKNYAGAVGNLSANRGQGVMFVVRVPKGSSALDMRPYSLNKSEAEVILRPKSYYRVLSTRMSGQTKVIEVEYFEDIS